MPVALGLEHQAHGAHVLQVHALAVRHTDGDVTGLGIVLACARPAVDPEDCASRFTSEHIQTSTLQRRRRGRAEAQVTNYMAQPLFVCARVLKG